MSSETVSEIDISPEACERMARAQEGPQGDQYGLLPALIRALRARVTELEQERDALTHKNKEQGKRNTRLQSASDYLERRANGAELERESLRIRVAELEALMVGEVCDLDDTVTALRATIATQDAEIERLKLENNSLELRLMASQVVERNAVRVESELTRLREIKESARATRVWSRRLEALLDASDAAVLDGSLPQGGNSGPGPISSSSTVATGDAAGAAPEEKP